MSVKKNLSENIVENVTYKQVRDAFKAIGFDSVSLRLFTTNLFLKELKAHYGNKEPSKREIEYDIGAYLRDEHINVSYGVELKPFIEKSKEVISELEKQRLILVQDDYISITDEGHTLRMQKSIQPIPLKKAEAILIKLQKSVEAFNLRDDSAFKVDEIYVYGSTQAQKEVVGDIDIAFSYSKNMLKDETSKEWRQRIMKTYNLSHHDIWYDKIPDGMKKALNVSTYLSKCDSSYLEDMINEGTASASLIYQRKGFEYLSIPDVKKYEYKHVKQKSKEEFELNC